MEWKKRVRLWNCRSNIFTSNDFVEDRLLFCLKKSEYIDSVGFYNTIEVINPNLFVFTYFFKIFESCSFL